MNDTPTEHIMRVHVMGPSYGRYICSCGWQSRVSGDGEPYEEQEAQRQEMQEHLDANPGSYEDVRVAAATPAKVYFVGLPSAAQADQTIRQRAAERTAAYEHNASKAIHEAIARSDREVILPSPMPLPIQLALRGLGYTVSSKRTGPNEEGVEVAW